MIDQAGRDLHDVTRTLLQHFGRGELVSWKKPPRLIAMTDAKSSAV